MHQDDYYTSPFVYLLLVSFQHASKFIYSSQFTCFAPSVGSSCNSFISYPVRHTINWSPIMQIIDLVPFHIFSSPRGFTARALTQCCIRQCLDDSSIAATANVFCIQSRRSAVSSALCKVIMNLFHLWILCFNKLFDLKIFIIYHGKKFIVGILRQLYIHVIMYTLIIEVLYVL